MSMKLPYVVRIKALTILDLARHKVERYWDSISKGEEKGITEDFRHIEFIIRNPLAVYSVQSAGGTEEERRMRAIFRWIEEELSFPEDGQLTKRKV